MEAPNDFVYIMGLKIEKSDLGDDITVYRITENRSGQPVPQALAGRSFPDRDSAILSIYTYYGENR